MSGKEFKQLSVKKCKNGFLIKEPIAFSDEYVYNDFGEVQEHLYSFFNIIQNKKFQLKNENIFWQTFSVFYNPIVSKNHYRLVQYFDGSTIVDATECHSLEECISIITKGKNI
mgnify:CR=1 FL=1